MSTAVLSLRDRLIGRAKVKSEPLTLTLDGEVLACEVREMSAGARGDLLTASTITREGPDGEPEQVQDLGKLYPQLIINSLYDPATGRPVFAPEDLELVRSLAASVFDPVIKIASRLSALGADTKDAIKGNSAATTVSASASPSPAN